MGELVDGRHPSHGPGPRAVPTGDPCYRCGCCRRWTHALELLRDSIKRHCTNELRLAPCTDECLVCAEIGWQG